jgi:hypothetical protein
MPITSDFELAASAPDDALAQAVRDPMSSPISQIAALSELRSRQQLRQEAAAAQGAQPGTVADKILAPVGYKDGGMVRGYKHGGIVQHFKDGSKGKPVSIIPESYIKKIEAYEGLNDPTSKNPHSTASGLYQFIDSTRRHLDKTYGFNPSDRSPETEKRRMMAYTQETIDELERNNIPVTGGTMYGGHLMGQRGVRDFYKAYQANPEARIEDFFSPDVIRKNPDIFNPRGGKKRETLAEVMTKLDQVGGGKSNTPRTAEDMNLGAALQVANRADRGDTGSGYEDAGLGGALALANMLEQTKTAPKPAPTPKPNPMAEDPTLAKLYAAIGARSRQPEQAGGGDDLQTIEEMNNQVRRRMAQFRQQQPMYGGAGETAGFRNGGIVQHFRDGSPRGVQTPDGRFILPLRDPRDMPGEDYDTMAYTGFLLGQPDMPPPDEPMSGADYIMSLISGIPAGSIPEQNPLGILPPASVMGQVGTNPLASTRGQEPDLQLSDILPQNPFGLTGEPARRAREEPARRAREENVNIMDYLPNYAEMAGKPTFSSVAEREQFTYPQQWALYARNFLGSKVPGTFGAIPEAVGQGLMSGYEAVGDIATLSEKELKEKWARDAAESTPKPKQTKSATPPAKAPPTTKLAPTGAPVSGTGASPAGNAPQVRGTGISAGIKNEPPPPPQNTPGSPYGPAEQYVRELYKDDAARQERLARREEEAKRMARIQAGLAIASGDSQYFAKNLARAIPVINDYQKTRAGLDEESDAFEQQFRERLIGARGIDIQQAELMKRTQAQNNAEVRKAEIEAASELQKLMREGALTERTAFEKIYEYYTKPNPLTGELPPIPAQYKDNRDAYIVELTQKTIRSLTPIPLQTTTKKPAAGG